MKKSKRQIFPTDLNNNKKNISFIVVSLIVHFLLMILFTEYSSFLTLDNTAQKRDAAPDVEFVDIAEWQKQSGELVDQDKANKKSPPDSAKFLSEKNNKVEKETKAQQRGEFKNSKSTQATKTTAQEKSQQPSAKADAPNSEFQTFSHGELQAPQQKPKKAKSISDLRLNSLQDMSASAASDSSQTEDYLKDVAIGAATHLNTREFLYFTYFNRIKKKLRDHWEPLIHTRVRDIAHRGRTIANQGTRVTRLVITLDDKGGLSRVQVSTTSGLLDLDEVAIEALKVSAPFPNPPKALIENGLVRINWDFILES